jgi:hypothetical protein
MDEYRRLYRVTCRPTCNRDERDRFRPDFGVVRWRGIRADEGRELGAGQYGGGRWLLDDVRGPDLGGDVRDGVLVLDLNPAEDQPPSMPFSSR